MLVKFPGEDLISFPIIQIIAKPKMRNCYCFNTFVKDVLNFIVWY